MEASLRILTMGLAGLVVTAVAVGLRERAEAAEASETAAQDRQGTALIQAQLSRDLEAARACVAQAPAEARGALEAEARRLETAIAGLPTVSMAGFRAVLPMLPLEREIFRLQAAAWRAQRKPALRVWTNCRWDPLEPGQEPAAGAAPPRVNVQMMNNEYRAGVFNLTNAAPEDQQLRVRVKGLPGGDNPGYLRVHEVLSVGTRRFAVSSALPGATRREGDWLVSVPSGMTRQVWLSFHPDDLPAGVHRGAIELRQGKGVAGSLPLRLEVFPLRFPDQTTLLMGGWDYTADEAYGVPGADLTPTNRLALVKHLQEHYVNAPWAGGHTWTPGSYNAEGKLIAPPDTSNFDQWIALWPEARQWMAVPDTGNSFEGSAIGTALFNTKVGNWAHFWARHVRERGFSPRQLGLCLVDEPSSQAQYDIVTAWGRAVKAAEPELAIWENPTFRLEVDLSKDETAPPDPKMLAVVDVLCPNRDTWNSPRMARIHKEPYQQHQQTGGELWLYNCNGPAHNLDPYAYYLLQQWQCFQIGARGTAFWAFFDSGGVSGWNEYLGKRTGYTPLYLDATSVTGSKHMEAIREGVQDYEYLTMLRARVEELERRGGSATKLARARRLLETACDRVPVRKYGVEGTDPWDVPKDRTAADTVRVEILQALTDLRGLK